MRSVEQPLGPEVERLLAEADRRAERIQQAFHVPGFIPSDHRQIYQALRYLVTAHAAPGNLFCEWGSGLGVATCLAAMNGLMATGIEVNPDLVSEARDLAGSFGLTVEFHCDSFIPQGSEGCLDEFEASGWLTTQAGSVQDEAGLCPENFDIIFVYPWPGEEPAMEKLFEQHAADGAILMTYRGREGVHLHRKVSEGTRTGASRRRRRHQSRR